MCARACPRGRGGQRHRIMHAAPNRACMCPMQLACVRRNWLHNVVRLDRLNHARDTDTDSSVVITSVSASRRKRYTGSGRACTHTNYMHKYMCVDAAQAQRVQLLGCQLPGVCSVSLVSCRALVHSATAFQPSAVLPSPQGRCSNSACWLSVSRRIESCCISRRHW